MGSKISNSINILLNLPRSIKTFIAISIDFTCCVFSVWFSFYLRLGNLISLSERGSITLFLSIIISLPIFWIFGLYKNIFRYSGLHSLLIVTKAISIYGILYGTTFTLFGVNGVPRTIGLIQPLCLLFLIISWRLIVRFLLLNSNYIEDKKKDVIKALVYGAGEAGIRVVKAIQENKEISVKGFLDDDIRKQGFLIDGKRIYSPNKLKKLIDRKGISLILLALPSISSKERNSIIRNLLHFKIVVRTIPDISNLASGKSLITEMLDLNIDDLLGRIEVKPFHLLMRKNIFEKTILVTGAGGSIGSELCRQIINLEPKKLILVEISEYALYSIQSELENLKNSSIEIISIIASIQDIKRMNEILSIFKPATIYHAAAYKHVPIVEHNLIEGLKNNFIGTFELAKLAVKNEVSNFVFISTDKAVRPTNVMGTTKRLAELCLQALSDNLLNKESKITKFAIVRFGNVLDSSGSVIPKFREQIKKGGPITLTDREITRYFMTITEASQLVIQAGAMTKGGDVFVLDMGKPIKIYDLAVRMIELYGLSVKNISGSKGDIEIKITGLRPGEKLYEEMLISNNSESTDHPLIYKAREDFIKAEKFWPKINLLKNALDEKDIPKSLEILKDLVPEWKRHNEK